MIEKIQLNDGTLADFNYEDTLGFISEQIQQHSNLNAEQAQNIAKNIIELVSQRFVSTIPSQADFDALIQLVLQSSLRNVVDESTELDNNIQKNNLAFEPASNQSEYENYEENVELEPVPESVEQVPETPTTTEEIQLIESMNVPLSNQARRILLESASFDELGRSIFLDRYSIKDQRENTQIGDLVIALTREDARFPKKELGIIKDINGDKVTLHVITGEFADKSNNHEFKTTIWKCDRPIESIKDAHVRVATAVATMEQTPELQEQWSKEFLYQLQKKHIQPAGRIMTGASMGKDAYTKNLTLFNCYVLPSPKDSRKSIIRESLFQMIEIMSRGGGAGINLSSLRPRYAYVKGVHGKSSGAVSWGGIFSYATGLIEQGGSRRGALMLMLNDWHPDVEEFINAKRQKGMIENANISILISDKFMDAVMRDENWNLEFPDYEDEETREIYQQDWDGNLDEWKKNGLPTKVYKTVKARTIWDQIVKSAHASAEPGIVFIERYNKLSNSYYFNTIICTNPCGEQGLPGWGVCNLGHLYMASFLKQVGQDNLGPLYHVDWEELKRASWALNRFLDNVIDLTPYHFKENEENQKAERRVGCGTLGIGEMLIKLRLRYGSNESLEFIDKIYKFICEEMYKSSSMLSKEKGPFPKFSAEHFLESGFVKTLSEDVKNMIRENGIRNVTLITQAPTGTVGTMMGSSTGVEPYYAFEFYQQSRLGFHKVKIPLAQQYIRDDGTLPNYFVTALELKPEEHIKVQAAVQKWTDSSISKTANTPQNFTVEETKRLYDLAYRLGCKGVTMYRDNSRSEQILSTDKDTEKRNIESAGGSSEPEVENTPTTPETVSEEPSGGSCELKVDAYGQVYKSCSE
ncbi:MAG: adenosylcobalamin-dependent ribonucleoside-diphosphate reductase [archaeon]|nr:adenosylcobalamin-dependent ribonucleoside-diphosphate reductase [Nanoarchaeota archaeon]